MSSRSGKVPKHGVRNHAVGHFDRKYIVQQRRASVNPDKTELVAFTRKRKSPVFLNHNSWG